MLPRSRDAARCAALPARTWNTGACVDGANERDSFLSVILSVAAAANSVTVKHSDGRFWLESPPMTFAVAPNMDTAGQQRASGAAQCCSDATNASGKPSSKSAAKRKRDRDRWNQHFKPAINPVASSTLPAQPASDEQQSSF